MYDKVHLSLNDAEVIYKEPVIAERRGRIILQTARVFQEFLGAADYKEGRVSTKGHSMEVNLDFPNFVPANEPLKNWFQVALFANNKSVLADPLNCSARYKGALPGRLLIQEPVDFILDENFEEGTSKVTVPEPFPAIFEFCEDPKHSSLLPDYMLFIYDSADYRAFWEGVHSLLGGYLDRGKAVVSDKYGNKILVSDDTKQPMLLIPISLLIGGLDYIYNVWDKILNGG